VRYQIGVVTLNRLMRFSVFIWGLDGFLATIFFEFYGCFALHISSSSSSSKNLT